GTRQFISGDNQSSRGAPPANISANFYGPITLQASKQYYLELIYSEGGGGNHGAVAVQGPGDPAVANGSIPISETRFTPSRQYRGNIYTYLGPVSIVQQPASATLPALQSVTFKVRADGTPDYAYQWKRNGVDIPGANAASYTIPVVLPTDDGALFSVVVGNEFSTIASTNASLAVVASQPPHVAGVAVDPTLTHVFVQFDNRVDPVSAQNTANYSIPGLTVMSATV